MDQNTLPELDAVEKLDWPIPINPTRELTPLSPAERNWALWRVNPRDPMSFEPIKAST